MVSFREDSGLGPGKTVPMGGRTDVFPSSLLGVPGPSSSQLYTFRTFLQVLHLDVIFFKANPWQKIKD
jgi:hypothetical protein